MYLKIFQDTPVYYFLARVLTIFHLLVPVAHSFLDFIIGKTDTIKEIVKAIHFVSKTLIQICVVGCVTGIQLLLHGMKTYGS